MVKLDGDNYKAQGMRRRMISELREILKQRDLLDEKVLEAMNEVPRHVFLDAVFVEKAYENIAFQIGAGQTISHPLTVAIQTTLLELKENEKVLEIGTGSGYQTSVLSHYPVKIYSIERQGELFDKTRRLLRKLNVNANLFYGDGYKGSKTNAPFDKIIVTCGAPDVPQDLLGQLKVGGRMVIPVGEGSQRMWLIDRVSEGQFVKKDFGAFSFVPMLERSVK